MCHFSPLTTDKRLRTLRRHQIDNSSRSNDRTKTRTKKRAMTPPPANTGVAEAAGESTDAISVAIPTIQVRGRIMYRNLSILASQHRATCTFFYMYM